METVNFDPKMKEREKIELLVRAIEENRVDLVQQAVQILTPKKLSSLQLNVKLVQAVAGNHNIEDDVLELLDSMKLLNRHNLISCLDESRNYKAMCWLLRDRESIELTEMNLPDGYIRAGKGGNNIRSCAGMLSKIAWGGLAGKLADLDIAYILRNERPRHSHEGGNIFRAALRDERASLEDMVKLSEVIWDPATYRLMYDNLSDEEIRIETIKGIKPLITIILTDESEDLKYARKIQQIASASPKLKAALDQYWKLPQEILLANHPGRWSPQDTIIISLRLPGIPAPADRDLLDCAIRCGADWVHRAIIGGGELAGEIWRRLKKDDGALLAGFIRGLPPTKAHKYVSAVISNVGKDWKDAQGRGLGHYFLRAADNPTAELLKSIARTKVGLELLSQNDENGKAAISFLENNEYWKPQFKLDLLEKVKYKLLRNIANRQPIERKAPPRPRF